MRNFVKAAVVLAALAAAGCGATAGAGADSTYVGEGKWSGDTPYRSPTRGGDVLR